ncbi:MAG TPA: hypothetical protein VGU67_13690 [Edaphobacter sp.]|nr:hypothetical protein [Edaphobacter sp.]
MILLFAFGLSAAGVPIARAQAASQTAMLALPDAPDAAAIGSVDAPASFSTSAESSFDRAPGQQTTSQMPMASPFDNVILPSEQAPALTARDKFLMGAKSTFTPFSMAGWLLSSGYSHLTNGPPNYGTDRGAFGQRLGAAAIRSSSEDLFTTSVMANVFHEDPRYYQMGRSHSIGHRIVYAATRVLITKSDSGKATVNLALLTGNLAGAALTNAYYPPRNHGVGQTMMIFGSSLGGSALGFGVSEFLNDALQLAHLKKSE